MVKKKKKHQHYIKKQQIFSGHKIKDMPEGLLSPAGAAPTEPLRPTGGCGGTAFGGSQVRSANIKIEEKTHSREAATE